MAAFNYNKLVTRWNEVTELPPQTIGPLTGIYKRITHRLKTMPLPVLVGISICLVFGLLIVLGPSFTALVSLLQRGF